MEVVVVVVEAVGEEEQEVVDSLLEVLLSLICHQTSVHPCILGLVSIPCCLLEVWEVQEEGGHPTPGFPCLLSSSTDRVGTHSTARHYLVVEGQEDLCLPWEAWALG